MTSQVGVELAISGLNVGAIWLTTHKEIGWGCAVGLIAQLGWVMMFCYTGQYGIVPMEIILAGIYLKHILQALNPWRCNED